MDIRTVHERVEHEGLSFLTITLPTFGKDFERSLDLGGTDRSLFRAFAWKAGLPRLFSGFLGQVFDSGTGVLLDDPNIDAITSVRQLTLMFGKVLVPCSRERVSAAIEGYVQCEQEVNLRSAWLLPEHLEEFRRVADMLYGDLFSTIDQEVFDRTLVPKHGPGATADRLRGNGKYRNNLWTARLEAHFPSGEYLVPSSNFKNELEGVHFLEPGDRKSVV